MPDKKVITRENWFANFNLVGKAKINDYTFKIDEKSEKSAWIYNSMNLGVDVGEKNGTVYANMMGGYSSENAGVIYAHGKKEDGSDDFKAQIQVAWEDRFDDSILESIGDMSFITVGIEKTDKDKTFYKKFLSEYDAIKYVKEHLEDGMVLNVRGNIKYSLYNDRVQMNKNITSIALSSAEPDKYRATFTQSILINNDSASLKDIDKDKGVMYVNARVLDYLKELNGIEIRGQYPFAKQFEFPMDFSNKERCQKVMNKLFKVKKDTVTQITFEGEFIEGGAVVTATLDDIPQDIKDLIDCGVYTEEEALARCSSNGNREQRMVLIRPLVRMVGDADNKAPVLQRFEEKYKEDDLYLDYLFTEQEEADALGEDVDDSGTTSTSADDMSWLDNL